MYVLYKVEVTIKAEIEKDTPLSRIIDEIENIPQGLVNFIEDENYLTATEKFIEPTTENASLQIFSQSGEMLFSNKKIK